MAFDIAKYYEDNKDKYQGRPMIEAARDVFEANKLGEKFGYKDHYEWLNDPANAKNKDVVLADTEQRVNNPQQTVQQEMLKQKVADAPSRGVVGDVAAGFGRGVIGPGIGKFLELPGQALGVVNDAAGAAFGTKPIDPKYVENLKIPGKAFAEVYSPAVSREELTDQSRASKVRVAHDVGVMAGQIGMGALVGAPLVAPAVSAVGTSYDETKKQALDSGKTEGEATAIGAGSGAIAGATQYAMMRVFGGLLGPELAKPAAESVTTGIQKLFNGGVSTAIKEYASAASAGTALSLADVFAQTELKRASGVSDVNGFDAVKQEFGPFGVVNLILGGMAPITHAMIRSNTGKALADGNANPALRTEAAGKVYRALVESGNPEAAASWNRSFKDVIAKGESIDLKSAIFDAEQRNPAKQPVRADYFSQFPEAKSDPTFKEGVDRLHSLRTAYDDAKTSGFVEQAKGFAQHHNELLAELRSEYDKNFPTNKGGEVDGLQQTEAGRPGQTEAPVDAPVVDPQAMGAATPQESAPSSAPAAKTPGGVGAKPLDPAQEASVASQVKAPVPASEASKGQEQRPNLPQEGALEAPLASGLPSPEKALDSGAPKTRTIETASGDKVSLDASRDHTPVFDLPDELRRKSTDVTFRDPNNPLADPIESREANKSKALEALVGSKLRNSDSTVVSGETQNQSTRITRRTFDTISEMFDSEASDTSHFKALCDLKANVDRQVAQLRMRAKSNDPRTTAALKELQVKQSRINARMDSAKKSVQTTGFYFPENPSKKFSTSSEVSSVKSGFVGPKPKKGEPDTRQRVLRVWPDKNNVKHYLEFVVDNDAFEGGLHTPDAVKSKASELLSADRHKSGTAEKNTAKSISDRINDRIAEVDARIKVAKNNKKSTKKLRAMRERLNGRLKEVEASVEAGGQAAPEMGPRIDPETLVNFPARETIEPKKRSDADALYEGTRDGVVDNSVITATNREERLHIANKKDIGPNERRKPNPTETAAIQKRLDDAKVSVVYNKETGDFYYRKKDYAPIDEREVVMTPEQIFKSRVFESKSGYGSLTALEKTPRRSVATNEPAKHSEAMADLYAQEKRATKTMEDIVKDRRDLESKRESVSAEERGAIDKRLAELETKYEEAFEEYESARDFINKAEGHEISFGSREFGENVEPEGVGLTHERSASSESSVTAKKNRGSLESTADGVYSRIEQRTGSAQDVDPIAAADTRSSRVAGLRTLLSEYMNAGESFDGRKLSVDERRKIFDLAPELQREFPNLVARVADTPFPAGKLGVSYDVKSANNIAQRVVSELRTYFPGKVRLIDSLGDLSASEQARLKRSGIPLDNVKSFFDPSKGEYVMIAYRHGSVGDLVSSVLHEGGHNAEPALFGSKAKADSFFSDVAGIFKTQVDNFMRIHGFADTYDNRLRASREVFSDMLGDITSRGDGTFKHNAAATMFQRAMAFVRDGIRRFGERFGISGLQLHYNEADIRSMTMRVLRGSHTLGLDGAPGHGVWARFKSTFVDKFQPIMDMSNRGKFDESSDAHGALMLMKSRTANFINDHIKPAFYSMGKLVEKSGLSVDEFNSYLESVHSIERNNDIVSRNPDPRLAHDAKYQNKEHARLIADLEKKIGPDGVKRVREAQNELRSIVNRSLDRAVDLGYYSKKEVDRIKRYSNYVTLRDGIDTSEPGKLSLDVSGGILRRINANSTAKGHDAVGSTIETVRALVVDTEKNFALRYLYNFAKLNPNIGDISIAKGASVSDRVIGVRVAGEQKSLLVHNQTVYDALKSVNDVDLPAVLGAFQKYNRIRIKLDLALNPYFWIRNLVGRDTIFGLANLSSMKNVGGKGGGEFAMSVLKDLPSVVKGIADINFKEGGSAKWGDYYRRYSEAGGKMGLAFIGNDTNVNLKLKNIVASEKGGVRGTVMKVGKAFDTWAEHMNDISENSMRLATFKNAVDAGMSDFAAARLAKEVSVNFDRQGSASRAMNSLYLYSNAYMQGLTQLAKVIRDNPKRFAAVGTGLASAGFMSAFAQRAAFGDDYDKIPDHVRSSNLVMMTGGDNSQYIKIALPGELLPFYNLGQYYADLAAGRPGSPATLALISNFVSSVNPIGGMVLDSDRTVGQSLTQMATPSPLRPFLEAFVQTNDRGQHMKWYGGPIKPGEEINYIAKSIAGGLGGIMIQGYKSFAGTADGVNDMPIASGFVGEAPWYMKGPVNNNMFKEAFSDAIATREQLSSLPEKARVDLLNKMTDNERKLVSLAGDVQKKLRIIASKRKKAVSSGRVGDAEIFSKEMLSVKKSFLEAYKQAK